MRTFWGGGCSSGGVLGGDTRMRSKSVISVCCTLALVLGIYCAGYFSSVRVDAAAITLSQWYSSPYYRGVPASMERLVYIAFEPIHLLDRSILRPSKWSGPSIPRRPLVHS